MRKRVRDDAQTSGLSNKKARVGGGVRSRAGEVSVQDGTPVQTRGQMAMAAGCAEVGAVEGLEVDGPPGEREPDEHESWGSRGALHRDPRGHSPSRRSQEAGVWGPGHGDHWGPADTAQVSRHSQPQRFQGEQEERNLSSRRTAPPSSSPREVGTEAAR